MTRQVTTLKVTEKSVGPKYNPITKTGNWDSSRTTVDKIIIHTMVGNAQSADSRFNDPTSNVSAHYGVLLTGEIWHWVDEDNTSYHAGAYNINQESIGIEHEDNGDYNGIRSDTLYNASGKLVKEICDFYGIPIDRQHILGHREVHATACPDALDIDRIVHIAQGNTSPPPTTTDLVTCQAQLAQEIKNKNETYQQLQEVQGELDGTKSQIQHYTGYETQLAGTLNCQADEAIILGEITKLINDSDQLRKTLAGNQSLQEVLTNAQRNVSQLQLSNDNCLLTNKTLADQATVDQKSIVELEGQLAQATQVFVPLLTIFGLTICKKKGG